MRTKNPENYSKIENYIDAYREANGGSPCIRDIAAATGIPKTTVSRYLQEMRKNGLLDYSGHRNIVTRKAREMSKKMLRVPVLGSVSCGLPKYAEENIEGYYYMPEELLGRGNFYYLTASGDSMIEAGIMDGDIVLVRQQSTAEPGQIVVALVGPDEATMKRFYPEPEKHRVRLHPENRMMKDIYVDDCEIQGIAVKLMRNIS